MSLYGKLYGHEACVNAVEFNSTGDLLVSGSDDGEVIFWNWASKTKLFAYPSGHSHKVFQTKIMPFTNDSRIVTSCADGRVRLGLRHEDGGVITTMLGKHRGGSVYKLAVEPGNPHTLYSCGEYGFVQHFDLRTSSATELFSCSSRRNSMHRPHIISLNSIVIDPRHPYYFAAGGSDEYARIYDIRKCKWDAEAIKSDRPVHTFCPHHLIGSNHVHITGMAYSRLSELLVSYNDELIYLFDKNAELGSSPSSATSEDDLNNLDATRSYAGHRSTRIVNGVNFFGPNGEYVVSSSHCGYIFIWNKKEAKLVRSMVGDQFIVHQLEAHPHLPILATSGIEHNVKIWAPLGNVFPPLRATTVRHTSDIMMSVAQLLQRIEHFMTWKAYLIERIWLVMMKMTLLEISETSTLAKA